MTEHSWAGSAGGGRDAVQEVAPWIATLARVGYAAKGTVYLIIGLVAARAALGVGGDTMGSREALRTIVGQPFGRVLLGVTAVGLFGYALWRFISSAVDAERRGNDARGIAVRVGHVLSGLAYGSLGVAAVQLLRGQGASGDGEQTQTWIRRMLDWPGGRWLVMAAGVAVMGYGAYQLWRAVRADIRKHLDLSALGASARWVERLGRAGLAARGIVFLMLGWLVLQAGRRSSAAQAGGVGDALDALHGAGGAWFLAVVALGLAAYGVYQLLCARYRRIAVT